MSIFDEMERDAVAFQRAPTAEESRTLTEMGLELLSIDARLIKYAEVAKQLTERKLQLQMKDMVSAMEAVGQDKIGLGDQDCDLVLEDYFKAGLPNPDTVKDDADKQRLALLREEGIAWLTEDSPDILTTTVTVTLPKGCLEQAQAIQSHLTAGPDGMIAILVRSEHEAVAREVAAQLTSEQGYGLPDDAVSVVEHGGFDLEPGRVKLEEGAHWATLTSFVKEQIRDRKRSDLPLEALGATVGRIVKIVKRKAKK